VVLGAVSGEASKIADGKLQRSGSMLTFEKDPFQGTESILEKLTVCELFDA